jgi:hypothetical protein
MLHVFLHREMEGRFMKRYIKVDWIYRLNPGKDDPMSELSVGYCEDFDLYSIGTRRTIFWDVGEFSTKHPKQLLKRPLRRHQVLERLRDPDIQARLMALVAARTEAGGTAGLPRDTEVTQAGLF